VSEALLQDRPIAIASISAGSTLHHNGRRPHVTLRSPNAPLLFRFGKCDEGANEARPASFVDILERGAGAGSQFLPYRQRVLVERDAIVRRSKQSGEPPFPVFDWLLPDVLAVHFKEIEGA
jgi:hypothetical protein